MTLERSVMMIESAALNYAACVQASSAEPESMHDAYCGAVEHLHHMALGYAAARGDLAAAERAELLALRRLRDGIVALRQELYDDARSTASMAIETIDALLLLIGDAP